MSICRYSSIALAASDSFQLLDSEAERELKKRRQGQAKSSRESSRRVTSKSPDYHSPDNNSRSPTLTSFATFLEQFDFYIY
jgi:hypothetical protein